MYLHLKGEKKKDLLITDKRHYPFTAVRGPLYAAGFIKFWKIKISRPAAPAEWPPRPLDVRKYFTSTRVTAFKGRRGRVGRLSYTEWS